MIKQSDGLLYKIFNIFTGHLWLKFISLILAVIVWFYIKGEMALFQ